MELQHFGHDHSLSFIEVTEDSEAPRCNGCFQKIHGPSYACGTCDAFFLHKSCAELPRELQHPLHSHTLTLLAKLPYWFKNVVCEQCRDLCFGFVFHCSRCQFNLDTNCASLTNNQYQPPLKAEARRTKLSLFCHLHTLMLINYGQQDESVNCGLCHLPVLDLAYCCLGCKLYLHESCTEIPKQRQHPFHPQHPLVPRTIDYEDSAIICDACKMRIKGISFRCSDCNFDLHYSCSEPRLRSLKYKGHEHSLFYFSLNTEGRQSLFYSSMNTDEIFKCSSCGDECSGGFYRCVRCDYNLHLDCIPIRETVQYENHFHPLKLMDSFVEDDSGENYCDSCENKRNPDHHVYHCEECEYVAHIECVVSENTNVESDSEKTSDKADKQENDAKEDSYSEQQIITQDVNTTEQLENKIKIQHFSHKHNLTFNENLWKYLHKDCSGCRIPISEPAYQCELCPEFWLHKSCAELPHEIIHPLHSTHPLSLYASPPYGSSVSICDGCNELCFDFTYHCNKCLFNLDVICATYLSDDDGEPSRSNDERKITRIKYFGHDHVLAFVNLTRKYIDCLSCRKYVLGPAYGCSDCWFFIHESCAENPQELQHPLHPQHLLISVNGNGLTCDACRIPIHGVAHSCGECKFNLHAQCADTLRPTLKHKCHEHKLAYFPSYHDKALLCDVCYEDVKYAAIYRCVGCNISLHLNCARLPGTIRSESHFHPLTLMDYVREDEGGEYYCDICEKERNPGHHVYYCKECTFLAHVHCAVPEEATSLEDVARRAEAYYWRRPRNYTCSDSEEEYN